MNRTKRASVSYFSKIQLYYRASRNSSDEKKNIESVPRHATIAILDGTTFLVDCIIFIPGYCY